MVWFLFYINGFVWFQGKETKPNWNQTRPIATYWLLLFVAHPSDPITILWTESVSSQYNLVLILLNDNIRNWVKTLWCIRFTKFDIWDPFKQVETENKIFLLSNVSRSKTPKSCEILPISILDVRSEHFQSVLTWET